MNELKCIPDVFLGAGLDRLITTLRLHLSGGSSHKTIHSIWKKTFFFYNWKNTNQKKAKNIPFIILAQPKQQHIEKNTKMYWKQNGQNNDCMMARLDFQPKMGIMITA